MALKDKSFSFWENYIFTGGVIKNVEKKQTCCHKIAL